jgi:hypothetical protein
MNREARRIEQLLDSLSKERRAELEPTLKGKKGKEKIKLILDEKKRVVGGTPGEKKLDAEEVPAPSRTQGKEGEKKKSKSKGKTGNPIGKTEH